MCSSDLEGEGLTPEQPHWLTSHDQTRSTNGVACQGLGQDILALPPMAGENTESPALLFSFFSFTYSIVRTLTGKKKKQPSSLSLLSLQRYNLFVFVCCKNSAFFK